METSKKFRLNAIDWKKIGKGALIAIAGTLLTYLTDLIPTIDFGVYTPVVVAWFSIFVNFANKWISWNKQ